MRALSERLSLVRACPFFSGLPEDELSRIAQRLTDATFDKGAAVFRAGDPSDAMFLLVKGRVSIRDGSKRLVSLVSPECFGELGALARDSRSADAICEESCDVVRLSSADLHALMEQRPALQRQVLLGLVRRVREAGRRPQ